MPVTSALRLLESANWALVLSIEDLPYAWTTHEDLVGTSLFDDGREVLQGLIPPTYTMGVDPQSDFQFKRTTTTIELEDFDGTLAALLSTFDGSEVPLFPSVQTTDDLAARTELHDRHVGNEYIGPSGERNHYPAIPGFSRPRIHIGSDYEMDEVAPVPVSELPIVLDGRRVVLWRVYRDVVTYPHTTGPSTWRPLSEADRCWWGTLRKAGHSVNGRTWKLECDGPESWIYKRLATLTQETACRIRVPLALDDTSGNDQTRIRLAFTSANESGTGSEFGVDDYTTQITGTETYDIRQDVIAAINATKAAAGGAGVFTDFYGHDAGLDPNSGSLWIHVNDIAAPNRRWSMMTVSLHEKVWLALGFDLQAQSVLDIGNEYKIDASRVEDGAPGPGYWEVRVTTFPAGTVLIGDIGDYSNGGLPRVHKPHFPGGCFVIPVDLESAPVEIELIEDSVHHAGQYDRPPMADTADNTQPYPIGAGVNRQGLWILHGPRDFVSTDDEYFEEAQIVHTSWREAGMDLAAVLGDPPTMVLKRFERPRDLGIDRGQIASNWVVLTNPDQPEKAVYATPILRLGYGALDGNDQAHIIIQRLLYTTGQTLGWSGYEGGTATLAATSNEPSGGPAGVRLDGEHEDLGCQIPSDMIAEPATWSEAANRLPSALRYVSLAIRPGMETESILRGLMTPRGWGWSLDGGVYGLLDFSAVLTPEGGTILDYSTKATDDRVRGHITAQELRAFAPKDRYVLRYNWNPLTQEFQDEVAMKSPDKGSRYRPYSRRDPIPGTGIRQGVEHVAEAHGTRSPAGWRSRMAKVAKWYDRGQFWIKEYPLTRVPGFDVWPGTKVVLTEPRAVGPDGTYGVTGAIGIVTSVTHRDGGKHITCDILVDASATSLLRFNAPSARGRGYDAATRTIAVDDDHLGIGSSLPDCTYFVEPSWSNLGGDAEIQIHQWDGAEWTITATGVVESVDDTPGASSITVASPGLTGVYRRDDDAIITLRPMPDQSAAWVLALFSPICDEDGQWNTPSEAGIGWA